MSNDYSREVLRRVVAQVCQIIGWQGINSTPLDILVHILEKYILTLCTQTQRYAEQFNRTEANLHDLGLVFRDIHIPLQELREYARCVPPIQCQLNVPKFPLPKESHLNFLKPGSQEVLTRPVHVHEYLPATYPEKEKECTPPIADTVEITQNGIGEQHDGACKSPEISVTDVPDKQKDIFKRPVDPVSITPPGLKRPRLKLEEEDCHTREISSVMMTMSGFLSPAREGKLPEARTPVVVHDTHPEKVKSAPHHNPASSHPSVLPHQIDRSDKKSRKNKALNGKIDKPKKKEKVHKNILMGKQKNAENRNSKLAMHLARGKVRPSGSVKHHAGEMPPLKQLPPSLDNNMKPIKQEVVEKPGIKAPTIPFNPALQPPPLVKIHKNPPAQHDNSYTNSEPPPLPPNITIKEEKVESEKLTSQPDRSKLNIFKKISSKIKEEKTSEVHDRFIHDNGAVKSEKTISRCNSPTLVIDEAEVIRQKMAHVKESIDFVVSHSAVDLSSKKSAVVSEVINVDDDSNDNRKHVFKQEANDDLPKDLSKPKLNAVHNLPASPVIKEKKERKRRERKPKPDKALKEYTKMLKKQQLEKLRNMEKMESHSETKISSRLPPGFPLFSSLVPGRGLIPGTGLIPGPGLIPGGGLFSGLPNALRGLIPSDTSGLLPNPFSLGAGGSGHFNRPDFLQSGPGLIPPNLNNPLLSHLSHSFGKPPPMPQHPNIPFLRRPSLEVIPIVDDNQSPKKGKQSYIPPPLLIKEKEKQEKSRNSPNSMIMNNMNIARTSPVKQSPPKPNPVIKMPPVKPDITIKLNPPEKPKAVDIPKPEPIHNEEPVAPVKEKDKSDRKKDKLHKKEKKDKELKIKKKKDKKDKLKIKIEKKKEKEERHDLKEKSKKEKKEKRKDKEKIATVAEALVPKLTLKLGPSSPMLPPSPDNARKLIIKPVIRKEEPEITPIESLPNSDDRLSAERSQSPELARISALVTRPPKSKPSHKHRTPVAKPEPIADLNQSLSPPPQPGSSSPTRKSRPPSTFSKHKRIYFKPIPKRTGSDDSIIDLEQDEVSPPQDVPPQGAPVPDTFPNVPLGTPFYIDPSGNKVWICPACGMPDNGSPMIGCDGGCDGWYHWVCVGVRIAPADNDDWYCTPCIAKRTAMVSAMAAGQTGKKRGRKPKAEKLKENQLG